MYFFKTRCEVTYYLPPWYLENNNYNDDDDAHTFSIKKQNQ